MTNGYQVVEPSTLNAILPRKAHRGIAVAILKWAVSELIAQYGDRLDNIEVEVIPVTYLGTYPAVGIRYQNDPIEDRGAEIESAINQIVLNRPVTDLVNFVCEESNSWDEVWREMT